jgi:hypothetical protein
MSKIRLEAIGKAIRDLEHHHFHQTEDFNVQYVVDPSKSYLNRQMDGREVEHSMPSLRKSRAEDAALS